MVEYSPPGSARGVLLPRGVGVAMSSAPADFAAPRCSPGMGRGADGGEPGAAGSSGIGSSARAGASAHADDAAGADSVRLTLAGLPAGCAPWRPMSCSRQHQRLLPCCYHSPGVVEAMA